MSRAAGIEVRHGKIRLVLHEVRAGTGQPLLHLHGLGEQSPTHAPDELARWPGPIMALDFTGHGASQAAVGGGYTCEQLAGDVDAAISHLGPVTIFGRGLGAYIGLLLAGARPEVVRGAVLFDGPGLDGGGPVPCSTSVAEPPTSPSPSLTPDPWAILELSRDIRPPEYATSFAKRAISASEKLPAIAVCGLNRPPWLAAVARIEGIMTTSVPAALEKLAEDGLKHRCPS